MLKTCVCQNFKLPLHKILKDMARKTCTQSKNDNPNWGKKIDLDNPQSKTVETTECFISNGPKVIKFSDTTVSYGGVAGGYSCGVK